MIPGCYCRLGFQFLLYDLIPKSKEKNWGADHWQTLTGLYHLTQRKINIKRETRASISVLSIASFVTMCSLLLQLHLTRENDPVIPFFMGLKNTWVFLASLARELVCTC